MARRSARTLQRLYSDPAFLERLEQEFEDGYKLKFNLAPPIMGRKSKATGMPVKSEFGAWMLPAFRILKRFKALRGTALDPFGRTEERRTERRLIQDYRDGIERALSGLSGETLPAALELAELPDHVRGFGHVKAKSVTEMETRRKELLAGFEA